MYIEVNLTSNIQFIIVFILKLRINLPLDYNVICLNPNSHKPQGQRGARTVSRFKKKEWVFDLRKMALILIVLLLAGTGLTLGQTCGGNCNCPSGTACSQSVCGANCGGSCTHDASVASSASVASPCGTHCPTGNCVGASGCKGCCGSNCGACCGSAAS